MKKMRIDEVCLVNPRQSVNLPENSKISFVPMAAVSVNGQVDSCDTLELKKAKNYTVFQNGDVLFAKITPCMENGKGAIVRNLLNGYGAGSTEFIVLRPKENVITAKWLYLYLSQRSFRWECQQHMTGSAGQKRVPPKYLASCEMPVPSIEEQERIVSKIEELFSRLDASVAELKTAKEKLKVYRQAVLKEAFAGEYPRISLKEIAKPLSGYAFKSKKYSINGKYVVVKIGNVKPFHFDFSRDFTKTIEVDDAILSRYLLTRGDCLITMTGSRGKRDYGYVVMVEDQKNYLLNQRVAALRFNPSVALPKFFEYYLSSPQYRNQFFSYETGNVGQGNVGIKALTEPEVICPPIKIQEEIIQKIEFRLSLCDSIEQTIDTSLQQAEALRQSILKQAFEGRLI